MVYYIEFPIIIRGFPHEIHYFWWSRHADGCARWREFRTDERSETLGGSEAWPQLPSGPPQWKRGGNIANRE